MKILSVVGARPQFVKAAVVLRAFEQVKKEFGADTINSILVHTGQHYDFQMSDLFFKELMLPDPGYNLGVGSGLHGEQTGKMLNALEKVCLDEQPDVVVVYGDTNSTLAGALAAAKLHIPVAHVEAGLRSFNRHMPEEINRVLTDQLATILFCPCKAACKNLVDEGYKNIINHGELSPKKDSKQISFGQEKPAVVNTGDVMVDALQMAKDDLVLPAVLKDKTGDGGYIVLTLHRAENVDNKARLASLLTAMADSPLPIILPIHPRTKARILAFGLNDYVNRFPFKVIEPLGYKEMLGIVHSASLVLTDSGGLQKEAFMLGVPCNTLRTETEWMETVEAGWNKLLPDPSKGSVQASLSWAQKVCSREQPQPYGDGFAGTRIASFLRMMAT
ncbi:MAG: UDP-N-acetyl glucosamine 2-epimerase [Syntrophaceticus sp.]|nr:UDP-N-acetyl glucosamine 2-epimerase [Syntrophaceticus sp.]MDD3314824.1 UDP-N-acetyl glucosamine 2-epimerase [Syntrophaceticus sp.]MDD4359623.1 UDP-N-acetyl glucosamine 2-epimerase [Syntrophaceticus sp.]MDD4783027.1 UDP-N-acetyl glucosamine 2-epimerase [Syntrophaceticus sp.]